MQIPYMNITGLLAVKWLKIFRLSQKNFTFLSEHFPNSLSVSKSNQQNKEEKKVLLSKTHFRI